MQRKINLGVVGCLLIMCLLPSLYKEFAKWQILPIDKKYAHPEWSIFNAKLKDHERKLLVPDGKNFIVVK